jgi:hypothetical protein
MTDRLDRLSRAPLDMAEYLVSEVGRLLMCMRVRHEGRSDM